MLRKALIAALLILPSIAEAQQDVGERVNAAIAMKIGALEIANASLLIQFEQAKAENARLQKLCGEPCQTKPEAKDGNKP